jgi:hypothetical protein
MLPKDLIELATNLEVPYMFTMLTKSNRTK